MRGVGEQIVSVWRSYHQWQQLCSAKSGEAPDPALPEHSVESLKGRFAEILLLPGVV